MVTILLEQIIEILKGWLSSFTSWAEDVAEKLDLIEEATEYIDDIYDDTTAIKANTSSIAYSNNLIKDYSLNISNKTTNIDSNVTAIKNNVGSIATSSGVTAAFSEDIATNTMNTLDKVTTIASDTTQLRADNAVVKSDLDKIYDALKWSLVGIDTTETEEGIGTLSFDTDKTDPLDQFDIAFTLIQEGTGDPTPDNVRAITGWTDFDVTANGSSMNLDLNGTFYTGSVNALTGDITRIWTALPLSSATSITKDSTCQHTYRIAGGFARKFANGNYNIISEITKTYTTGHSTGTNISSLEPGNDWTIFVNANSATFFITADSDYDNVSAADFKTEFANVLIACELAAPSSATAANTLSINTNKGLNTITSDSNGTMTVTYTESVKHYLDKQEG